MGTIAKEAPLKPPIVKSIKKATANIIETVILILPLYKVPIQLMTFTPVGIPMSIELAAKKPFTVLVIPTANIW